MAQDLVDAYLADAEALLSLSEELRREYDTVRHNYAALAPNIRCITDRLLPWILHLRVQYDDVCADAILALYARESSRADRQGLLLQPN
jgi:hypothetical protein